MSNNKPVFNMQMVPYIAFESAQARSERTNRRLWILALIMSLAFILSNVGWIIYESSFTDITVTQENEEGYNNYIGSDGEITYGKTDD